MEYTEEQIVEIIHKAFKAGEQWGVTYSTRFIPNERNTEERIQEVVSEVFSNKENEVEKRIDIMTYKITMSYINGSFATIIRVSSESLPEFNDWFDNAKPDDVLVVITENKETRIKREIVLTMQVELE